MINSENEKLQAYVVLADADCIRIKIFDDTIIKILEKRGYNYVGESTWKKDVNEEEKIVEMVYLRDAGIPFSAGPGWPPSAVFEYLAEQGKLNWPYKKIGWSGPGKYTIVEYYRDSSIPPWKKS